MINQTKENYSTLLKIEEDMKFLTKSEIRLKILRCLNFSPTSIKEIVKKTGLTYSSVSSNINKLQKKNKIVKKDNKFQLSHITQINLENILDFHKTLELIENYEKFWNKHNIDFINHNAQQNLTDLYSAQLIESTSIDIYKTHNTIKKYLLNSKKIKAIFPYLHPDYPKIIESILENNGEIELIINDTIYNNLILKIKEETRQKAMKNNKLIVHSIKKPVNIYLTSCETHMSLGLFKNDGSFDQNRILFSSNERSIKWGDQLFQDIKNKLVR